MNFISMDDTRWQLRADDDSAPPRPGSLLSLEQWQCLRGDWPCDLPAGIVLPNTAELSSLVQDLPRWALVVLQFEDLIGYFLNSLVLRVNLAGDPTFEV